MALPTPAELELLKKFKTKVEDVICEMPEYHQSDTLLLSWIRAREGNLVKAEEMLRKATKWRKQSDFYNLSKWDPPPRLVKDFPYEITGYTKEGYPIVIIRFGKWDMRQMVENGEKELMIKYTCKLLVSIQQDCIERSILPNNIISQFVFIVDFDGYSLKQLKMIKSVLIVSEIAEIFDTQFPETMNSCVVINAPKIFPMFFSVVKHVMSTKTVSKLQIHDVNPDKWKLTLLRKFPADQFPREFGGCRPELKNPKISSYEADFHDDLQTIVIPSGQDLPLFFNITSTNSQIRWVFKTSHYDIGFSVLFEDETEIHPYEKYNSHIMTQEGGIRCTMVGTYFLIFDNKYSRVRGKTLHYKAYVSTSNNNPLEN